MNILTEILTEVYEAHRENIHVINALLNKIILSS